MRGLGGGWEAAHKRCRLEPREEMSANSAVTEGSSTALARDCMAGPKRSFLPVSGLQIKISKLHQQDARHGKGAILRFLNSRVYQSSRHHMNTRAHFRHGGAHSFVKSRETPRMMAGSCGRFSA